MAFLGPSLSAGEAQKLAPGVTLLPPARQGDVWRALAYKPRAIALIDGVFESQPSVWHHELLSAIDCGITLFGAASMGALRAAELEAHGMIGVGQIFRWYRDGTITDDSEVALLHADAEHGYRPLTIPLVNIRAATRDPRVIDAAARVFYQERRSWPRGVKPRDLKAEDARECLRVAFDFVSRDQAPPAPRWPLAPVSSLVRRRRIADAHGDFLHALKTRPDAWVLQLSGVRRLLLAGWAKSMGLVAQPDAAIVQSIEDVGFAPDEARRIAEVVALEALVSANASRVLDDGPSDDESLFLEGVLEAAQFVREGRVRVPSPSGRGSG